MANGEAFQPTVPLMTLVVCRLMLWETACCVTLKTTENHCATQSPGKPNRSYASGVCNGLDAPLIWSAAELLLQPQNTQRMLDANVCIMQQPCLI